MDNFNSCLYPCNLAGAKKYWSGTSIYRWLLSGKNKMKNIEILRLKKDDELILGIIKFCQSRNIKSAWFSGLGAAQSIRLALYNLKKKEYTKKEISGPLEFANITGNIGLKDGQAIVHCHATVSDKNMMAHAGHVEEAVIGATCEIIFQTLDVPLTRKHNEEIGLNLLDL